MDEDPERSKNESEALMEHLRKNPPRVKSISEVANLLHVISAEQRSCNVLRSCVDKVLMNMSNIRSLRDIIERLRSVSRTNGFRFELPTSAGPETRCQLASDMFSVKIVLGTLNTPDHSPTVLDVSIKHKEDYRSSPHLANVIRAGNFLELSNHLKGLMEMYSTSGSRQSRTRVYMALQSLETDLVKMSQMYRETHKEASIFEMTMEGTVGFLTPRLAGDRPHFAYYISPYDLIDTKANCRINLKDNVPRNIGLHGEVSIEQRQSSCSLPISPLISNKHPIDSSGLPRFMDVSHHNSTSVPACFVLHLKPAVPILNKIVEDIKRVTGLELSSDENSSKRYLNLLSAEKVTYKVLMGDETHVYYLDMSEQRATLVSKVYFSQPGHLIKILDYLRKQAHLNTLVSSCVRDLSSIQKKGREWYFEVSLSKDIERVNVTLENPSSKGTAILEIKLEKSGFPNCKIFTGRGDPPLCEDDFVVKVLQKCSSLPITMRKVIEQSIKNPKKELDIKRPRPLFPPPNPQPPNILTPVSKPTLPMQQRQQSIPFETAFQGTMPDVFSPVQTQAPPSAANRIAKKCYDNPLLTGMLLPSPTPSEIAEPADQPVKNHPMLLTLLKDDNEQERPQGVSQRSGKTGHMNPPFGFLGSNQQGHFNPSSNNLMGMMSHGSGYSNNDPQIPVPASPVMPPPSYPSPLSHGQMNQPGQMPVMSPAYPSQRSPMGGLDDMTGPVTPLNPLGMMSPGLISPGISQGPNMQRARKASRQKSHSTDNHDFSSFDLPQYESQTSVESDASISELLGIQNRTGMTPLRRTDSLSSETIMPSHMPLQHSSSLKTMSASSNNLNLLTRSVSVSSGKSMRSMTSPVSRGLRTPEGMMTLASPPMFDTGSSNQRGPRVKSIDMDFYRSSLPSTSPGGTNLPLSGGGPMHDPDSDPFTFDDNKNPSKISMPDTPSAPGSRTPKQSLVNSTSIEQDDTLRELAKTKPVLLRALTGDGNVMKSETQSFQRQLGISTAAGLFSNLSSGMMTQTTNSIISSGFDFPKKMMMSATVSTAGDKSLVRQNAIDKAGTSAAQQTKGGEIKAEKVVKKRNSYKGDEGKVTAKKRGRPPSVKDHAAKKRKQEDGPYTTLNIQLSSTGAPISSTTKTKPALGSVPPNKNQSNTSSAATSAVGGSAGGQTTPGPSATNNFGDDLVKYLRSQEELQKRKEKKGIAKPLSSKQSFSGQSSNSTDLSSVEKTPLSTQQVKQVGTLPRNAGGLPAPRKRKSSIREVVERLVSSKMPDVGPGGSTGSSSPDTTKQSVEKDANSNLLPKAKPILQSPSYQKAIPSTTDKTTKSLPGQKPVKIAGPKLGPPGILTKQGSFTAVSGTKSGRSSTDLITDSKGGNSESMVEVLKQITEAAAATTKRNPTSLNKPASVKVQRQNQPVKPRSITPTGVAPSLTPVQRKSPSSQMMKTLSTDLSGRPVPLKMSSNQGGTATSMVKKSPMRIQSVGGMPSRPSSTSMETPLMQMMKAPVASTSAVMMNLSRKVQPDDQHFVAPSISPTPKRNSSPQIQRTTSPLTRVDDKAKGLPGRSPNRPSPTPSRIATPVQSNTPSPDDRLLIDDPSITVPGISLASLSRDDQRPVFIPGSRANERQSPERTAMLSPLSPQQKSSSGLLQSTKRAPTPRNSITSPGMSPLPSSSPFSIDDDLMNQAVTG